MINQAIHQRPIWGSRADARIEVDLSIYGMPGKTEVVDVETGAGGVFTICCVPFFIDNIALGDVVTWDQTSRSVRVSAASGHAVLRIATVDPSDERECYSFIHAWLEMERLYHEWRGYGYVVIDIPSGRRMELPTPLREREQHGTLQIDRIGGITGC